MGLSKMDVFNLRERVVTEYRGYGQGFLRIADQHIRKFVVGELDRGYLWPDPLVQLNPGYERGTGYRLSQTVNQAGFEPATP